MIRPTTIRWATALAPILWISVAGAATVNPGPLPSEFHGGYLDVEEAIVAAELQYHKEAQKLSHAVGKCFTKGARNVWRGRPSGVDACINDPKKGALVKFSAKVATIAQAHYCLPAATEIGQKIIDFSRSLNVYFYCASPAGAFVDPLP